MLVSKWHETEPVDCPAGSGRFLNGVVEIAWRGTAEELFEGLTEIETSMGRPKERPRNAPRRIDLDLLYLGDLAIDVPGLIIPHPRIAERAFVLCPLAEIRPELVLPGCSASVAKLLDRTGKQHCV
jgi:2-amino-4-hydroxy-6-hydroxymethyldihydropteridine diphosphokinase